MNAQIFGALLQDGVTNGAIYVLLALSLVLVFSVTRILFLAQGEFVVYGALTYATMLAGRPAPIGYLVLALGCLCAICDVASASKYQRRAALRGTLIWNVVVPGIVVLLACIAPGLNPPPVLLALIATILVALMGPMVYRLAFQPVADASILTLMIVATAVHFTLTGLALYFFGPEGLRAPPFLDKSWEFAGGPISAQGVILVVASSALIATLWLLFDKSLAGKALRATALSRRGASLLAIRTVQSGKLAFALAAGIGAFAGMLIVPLTTIYFDSGLLIGMKGFIAAVCGAMLSMTGAAAGALLVGLVDSFGAFWASQFKDAILFLMIIPVLLWLSLNTPISFEHEEES